MVVVDKDDGENAAFNMENIQIAINGMNYTYLK